MPRMSTKELFEQVRKKTPGYDAINELCEKVEGLEKQLYFAYITIALLKECNVSFRFPGDDRVAGDAEQTIKKLLDAYLSKSTSITGLNIPEVLDYCPELGGLIASGKSSLERMTSGKEVKKSEAIRGSDLLRPKQAAELLGVSLHTLYVWRTKGTGPEYNKISAKNVRYSVESINDFLAKSKRRFTTETSKERK